jgi:hypothetical protein
MWALAGYRGSERANWPPKLWFLRGLCRVALKPDRIFRLLRQVGCCQFPVMQIAHRNTSGANGKTRPHVRSNLRPLLFIDSGGEFTGASFCDSLTKICAWLP